MMKETFMTTRNFCILGTLFLLAAFTVCYNNLAWRRAKNDFGRRRELLIPPNPLLLLVLVIEVFAFLEL